MANDQVMNNLGLEKRDDSSYPPRDEHSAPSKDLLPEFVPTTKAYKDSEFLNSSAARLIRIQCELEQPKIALDQQGIDNIVMFFGSARAKSRLEYEDALKFYFDQYEKVPGATQDLQGKTYTKHSDRPDFQDAACEEIRLKHDDTLEKPIFPSFDRLRKQEFLIQYYTETIELARKLSEWSAHRRSKNKSEFVVGTGGGPGMMSAANQGAYEAGEHSLGFGISLPFEAGLNSYVTPSLAFEFHYFFTRKFWMAYKMMGLIIAPGGYGTCDELFELLTLMQTRKIKRHVPVILLGKKFWDACINLQAFVDYGMISQDDCDRVHVADTADEAFEIWKREIKLLEQEESEHPTVPMSPKREKSASSAPGSPGRYNAY